MMAVSYGTFVIIDPFDQGAADPAHVEYGDVHSRGFYRDVDQLRRLFVLAWTGTIGDQVDGDAFPELYHAMHGDAVPQAAGLVGLARMLRGTCQQLPTEAANALSSDGVQGAMEEMRAEGAVTGLYWLERSRPLLGWDPDSPCIGPSIVTREIWSYAPAALVQSGEFLWDLDEDVDLEEDLLELPDESMSEDAAVTEAEAEWDQIKKFVPDGMPLVREGSQGIDGAIERYRGEFIRCLVNHWAA